MKTLAYRFTALLFAALLAASLMAQTPVRVVSIVSLAAGSNAIGKLSANSGVDIGDVDVTSSALPTGASTLAEQQAQTTALQLIDNAISGAGFNITQQGGVAVSLNTGVRDSGTQRVTIATNDLVPVSATNLDVQIGGSDSLVIGTFPDNEPFNMAQRGGVAIVSDPCQREARIFFDIDQTAGEELINGTASERIVICELFLMSATAQSVALVSGTGTVCATSTTSVLGFGGLSAATGQLLSISGGFQRGDGGHALGTTTADDDNVCLLQSASGQVSGGGSYVSLVP